MKNTALLIALLTIVLASCVKDRVTSTGTTVIPPVSTSGDSLICYYNCNIDTLLILKNPTYFRFAGDSMGYAGSRYDTVQPGTTINAQGLDTVLSAGSAGLRLRNPSGDFTLALPTTGFKNIVLKYAVERSSKGAQTNTVMYTIDGTNYISTAISSTSVYSVDTVWNLVSQDFSSDPAVNNNPKFKVKISFSNASGTTTGNDRFDNITLWGIKQ